MNNIRCPSCQLINFATDETCRRCATSLHTIAPTDFTETNHLADVNAFVKTNDRLALPRFSSLFKRVAAATGVAFLLLLSLHSSLLLTSAPINTEERRAVMRAVRILEERGFISEVYLLRHLATFRREDNWWNNAVGHADAYAATNFPFEIVTLYPEFFSIPVDDTERAAILLHEAQHLRGANEVRAFTEVWQRREQLGWTKEAYGSSRVWRGTAELTREYAPHIFDETAAQIGDRSNSKSD